MQSDYLSKFHDAFDARNADMRLSFRNWSVYAAAALVRLKALAPYALIELIMPGGSVIALLLWLYRRRKGRVEKDLAGDNAQSKLTGASKMLVQLQVLRARLLHGRNPGVVVLPKRKEILILPFRFDIVGCRRIGATKLKVGRGSGHIIKTDLHQSRRNFYYRADA